MAGKKKLEEIDLDEILLREVASRRLCNTCRNMAHG